MNSTGPTQFRFQGIHRRVVASALFVIATVSAPAAFADDTVAKSTLDEAIGQIASRKYDDALGLLDAGLESCKESKCSASVEAELYMNQGLAYGLKDSIDKARDSFQAGLAKKSNVEPNAKFMTRKLKQIFSEAQAKAKTPEPPKPGALTSSQSNAIESAARLLASNDWEGCLAAMVQSMAGGDYAAGKLMAARCQDKGDLLVEAKRDAEAAVSLAKADKNEALAKEAGAFVEQLDGDIPRINLKFQAGVTDLLVKIDGAKVDDDKIRAPIGNNPGTVLIEVTGKRGGEPYEFSKKVTFQRSEQIDLDVVSTETPLQACYRKARNANERKACDDKYNPGAKGLNFKAGLEVSSYNDTNHVDVVSPALYVAAVQPTQGWNFGGQAIVDVVSTASADIVAMASRRFDQVRVGGSVGGGYKVGPATVGVSGATSIENDYVARSAGVNVTADILDKMVSPYLTYDYGFDILGRANTEFAVFRRDLQRHTVNFGASVVLNPSTVGVLGGTVEFDLGDASKPYRYVPMFDASVAPEIPLAASAALVAAGRLPVMPLEQLPTSRQRLAVLVGLLHRFETSTIRGTERIYTDDWGQFASTTDVRFLWDIYEKKSAGGSPGYPQLRLSPHGRFNYQGPVSFWQRAYVASQSVGGYEVPKYRTGDRELGPLWAVTGGLGLRTAFNRVVSINVQADAVYTRFLDDLYLFDRWGLFTASTLELEFD